MEYHFIADEDFFSNSQYKTTTSTSFFFLEHAGELRVIVLRGKNSPITNMHSKPWTRERSARIKKELIYR